MIISRHSLSLVQRCRSGVAAIEFALVFPLGVVVYLGLMETTNYLSAYGKMVQATIEIEDLIGRQTSVSNTTFTTVAGFAKTLMQPLNLAGFTLTIANETVDYTGTQAASPAWVVTCTSTSTAMTCTKQTTNLSTYSIALPQAVLDAAKTANGGAMARVSQLIVKGGYTYNRITHNSNFGQTSYALVLSQLTPMSFTKFGVFRYVSVTAQTTPPPAPPTIPYN